MILDNTMLRPHRVLLSRFRDALIPPYIDYCRTVSRRSMAVSLQTATYLWWVCDRGRATNVCDLGSGFSSYVLGRHAAMRHAAAVSVDNAPEWLDRTRDFLVRAGLDTAGLTAWVDWQQTDVLFDVILHDFASGELRNTSMWEAASRLAPGGVLIFDDAQHDGHRAEMLRVAAKHHLAVVDIHEYTLDEVRRYAMAAQAA